jgi:cation diffusion facilitator CzcD-associated flavoprotein CzcO
VTARRKRVVVIGAGIAGLITAKVLYDVLPPGWPQEADHLVYFVN